MRINRKKIIKPIDEDLTSLFEQARNIREKNKLSAKQMDEMIEHEILMSNLNL